MGTALPAYGLWPVVVINAAVFIIFAFSFTRPRTSRNWHSFGSISNRDFTPCRRWSTMIPANPTQAPRSRRMS